MNPNRIKINWIKAVYLAFAVCLTAGCGVQTAGIVQQEGDAGQLEYEIVKPPYHTEIDKIVNAQKQEGGTKVVQRSGNTYIVISLGQRPSGGYAVELKEAVKSGGEIIVRYSEKKPQGMAISVLSYPTLVLKLPKTDLPVTVERIP